MKPQDTVWGGRAVQRAAVPLVLLMLLAGCSQSAAPGADAPGGPGGPGGAGSVGNVTQLPDDLGTLTALPELKLGSGDGEPNIAVDANGTIYITPVSNFYVSTDGGKSFTDRGTTKTVGHGDGDIAIDERGCVHWLGLSPGIPYQVSCDQGKTFSDAVDISNGTGSDREWIDAAGAQIAASWRDGAGYVSRVSQDHGAHWGPKVLISSSSFLGGPIIHDPRQPSRLWIPGTDGPTVDLYRSDDAGGHWNKTPAMPLPNGPADVLQPTQIFPVVAQDDAGNLYMVVSTKQPVSILPTTTVPKQASLYGIYLAVSTDLGKTWSDPRLLSTPMKDGVMPFITAGAKGRIAIVWYENTIGLPDDVLPDLWNVKMFVGIGQDTGAGKSQVVQLNGQPNHIGGLCSNGLICVAGGDRCLLDYFEVALNPAGYPVVTWSNCSAGTGAGVAAVATTVYYGGIANGTPLR